MKLLIALCTGLALTTAAHAETKVLKVNKMHCEDCVATLKDKLCGMTDWDKCEVKIIDEKKELGQVTLATKGDKKIDMKQVAKIVEDEGYTLKK